MIKKASWGKDAFKIRRTAEGGAPQFSCYESLPGEVNPRKSLRPLWGKRGKLRKSLRFHKGVKVLKYFGREL